MKKNILSISAPYLVLLGVLLVGAPSCKSKRKMAQVTSPQEEVQEETAPISENQSDDMKQEETPLITEERVPEKIPSKEQQLDNYFSAVSSAASVSSANASIQEALNMFNTPEAPVLIVIYNDGANPDYDEPTTIAKYLDYLKDTKNEPAKVEEVVYTGNGKIKELVLKK